MAKRNNELAVSPIVATLVLIVVAVIGAVAVGTIMGSFSSDVSKASAGQAAQASSTDVLIAGSFLMQPAMNLIAADYMAQNPGITLNVQGGGSNAGLSSTANGISDVGTFAFKMRPTQYAAYPNVKENVVGYSGIVPIVNGGSIVTSNVTLSDLERAYSNDFTGTSLPAGITTAVVTTYGEGFSDTFASLIGVQNIYSNQNASVHFVDLGGEVVYYVSEHPNTIGYVPLEDALSIKPDGNGIKILDYAGTPKTHETDTIWPIYTWQSIRDAKNGVSNPLNFPVKAIHPLEILTNGQPSALGQSIISFTQSPDEAARFHGNNFVHISDVVTL